MWSRCACVAAFSAWRGGICSGERMHLAACQGRVCSRDSPELTSEWLPGTLLPSNHSNTELKEGKNPLSVGFGNPCCHDPAASCRSQAGSELAWGLAEHRLRQDSSTGSALLCSFSPQRGRGRGPGGGLLGTPPCRLACLAGLGTQPYFEAMSCSAGEAMSCSSCCLWSRMIHMELPLIS